MSKVIKKSDAPNVRAETLDFSRLNAEAEAVLKGAKQRAAAIYAEAARVLEEAKRISAALDVEKKAFAKKVDSSCDEARKRGFEDGKKAGFEQGRQEGRKSGVELVHREAYDKAFREKQAFVEQESKPAIERLAQIVETLQAEFDRIRVESQRELVHLSIAVAEKIVRREINADPSVVLSAVHKAIDLSIKKHGVRVRISPDDFTAVNQYIPNLKAAFARVEDIVLVSDESIRTGGCVIESGAGSVDMRIETQLAEIERALTGREPQK